MDIFYRLLSPQGKFWERKHRLINPSINLSIWLASYLYVYLGFGMRDCFYCSFICHIFNCRLGHPVVTQCKGNDADYFNLSIGGNLLPAACALIVIAYSQLNCNSTAMPFNGPQLSWVTMMITVTVMVVASVPTTTSSPYSTHSIHQHNSVLTESELHSIFRLLSNISSFMFRMNSLAISAWRPPIVYWPPWERIL